MTAGLGIGTAADAPADGGIAAAYSATGGAWQNGPGRIYDRLADVVVAASPVIVAGRSMLDLGSGTGAASRAALRAGAARVVAVDVAPGVLAHNQRDRPPAVVADTRALPFVDGMFDVSVAAFALNHLADPAAGLREMARVTRPGGGLVASSYAADDDHPVKSVVEGVLAERGWKPEPWYRVMRESMVPLLATPEHCLAVAASAGVEARVEQISVRFPELTADDLVAWRLGMAHNAPFVARLPAADQAAVVAEAAARLRPADGLTRSILVLSARRT